MQMVQQTEQELKVQMELNAHEKECAIRYEMVHGKLEALDKRMWRLEAMIMGSTVMVVAMVITVFMGMN
ncbi:hypothetical protein N386_gp26 [Puniceispirillum phage HMO-2011]|uniref:hypothetical protein n=1 Tax=Puniceispirillum phage HMO-2011 TaxID=948071 RepID=UPI000351F531|nr:hypothetical protein N386_gp26 [Puniceispirillum phage HMO-2011]AFV50584.1 hypothetical protein phage1322_26 [Puniceispirillum phage HMO-2011]